MTFFGLFGKKERKDSKVSFESKLVPKLLNDHKKLVEKVQAIESELHKPRGEIDEKKIRNLLKSFRVELLGHFMEEDIKLYWYLEHRYGHNDTAIETIKSFKESIKGIQKEVMRFIDSYTVRDLPIDNEFFITFREVVKALSDRIQAEENNLYPLYIP